MSMPMDRPVSRNMEDYLETIHILEVERGVVRVKDIADRMRISRASVSGAVNHLEKQGLVSHRRYDLVRLTESGVGLAAGVYERHRTIRHFLSHVLGLNETVAEQDACRIEHSISPETFRSMKRFLMKHLKPKKPGKRKPTP